MVSATCAHSAAAPGPAGGSCPRREEWRAGPFDLPALAMSRAHCGARCHAASSRRPDVLPAASATDELLVWLPRRGEKVLSIPSPYRVSHTEEDHFAGSDLVPRKPPTAVSIAPAGVGWRSWLASAVRARAKEVPTLSGRRTRQPARAAVPGLAGSM